MEPTCPRFGRLLNFLTGDDWTLKTRPAKIDLGLKGAWPHAWRPQAVALFSGGLDSLVGAIDLLEQGRRLVLVSHYDFGQLASLQQGLAAALTAHYGSDQVYHLGVRLQFPEAPELTLRSRSLLYLALALATAAAFGAGTPVLVPENGWISLNPPLTGNRLGAYSTRTTHPHFLAQLASLWQRAGLPHPLANPYQDRTKGEMLLQLPEPAPAPGVVRPHRLLLPAGGLPLAAAAGRRLRLLLPLPDAPGGPAPPGLGSMARTTCWMSWRPRKPCATAPGAGTCGPCCSPSRPGKIPRPKLPPASGWATPRPPWRPGAPRPRP